MSKRNTLAGEFFWVDRWTASSAFYLSIEARGLYREMLSQAWLRGAHLPNDPEAIRRIVGASEEEWTRSWPKIAGYWRVTGDLIVNDTQLSIYAESLNRHEKLTEAGRIGGIRKALNLSRKNKPENIDDPSLANSDATSLATSKAISKIGSKAISKASSKTLASGSVRTDIGTYAQNSTVYADRASLAELPDDEPDEPGLSKACARQGHVAPMACARGVHVYDGLHKEFVGKLGGDQSVAGAKLRRFYADVIGSIPTDEVIAEDSYVFWRRRFAECFGPPSSNGNGNGNRPAEYIQRIPSYEETRAMVAECQKHMPDEAERERMRAKIAERQRKAREAQ